MSRRYNKTAQFTGMKEKKLLRKKKTDLRVKLKSFFFLISRDNGKSYFPHNTASQCVCSLQCINLKHVFFCSAWVEYFSNEWHRPSDEHTHTHHQKRIWKWNQAGDRRLAEAKGHNRTHVHAHTDTQFVHLTILVHAHFTKI